MKGIFFNTSLLVLECRAHVGRHKSRMDLAEGNFVKGPVTSNLQAYTMEP